MKILIQDIYCFIVSGKVKIIFSHSDDGMICLERKGAYQVKDVAGFTCNSYHNPFGSAGRVICMISKNKMKCRFGSVANAKHQEQNSCSKFLYDESPLQIFDTMLQK